MLRYAMGPERFAKVIAAGLPGPEQVLGQDRDGAPVRLGQVLADVRADYAWLWRRYSGLGGGPMELADIHTSPMFRDFETKMHWLHLRIVETLPMRIAYPWLVYLLDGFTPEEAYALGEECIRCGPRRGRPFGQPVPAPRFGQAVGTASSKPKHDQPRERGRGSAAPPIKWENTAKTNHSWGIMEEKHRPVVRVAQYGPGAHYGTVQNRT